MTTTLKAAMRATGLTRRQLRYLEERLHLGFVARVSGRTVYTQQQFEFLQAFASFRALELTIDEAAQITAEYLGAEIKTPPARLLELAARALLEVEQHSRVAAYLVAIRRRGDPAA